MKSDYFTEFVERTEYSLTKTITLRVGLSDDEARDIVYDVYANLLAKDYPEDKLEKIAVSAIMNRIKNEYRKKNKRSYIEHPEFVLSQFSSSSSSVRAFESQDFMDHMPEVLSERQYSIIMKHAEGYSQNEIADEFGITTGCVRNTIFIARQKLKKLL
jgi:RNA polymerase sigma factor (sigma-70 family)